MTDLSRSDFDRLTRDLKLPRGLQTFYDVLLAISPADQLPSADAEDLRAAIIERTGIDIPAATLRQQRKRLDEALAEREMPFSVSTRKGRVVIHANERWDAAAISDSVRQSLITHSQGRLRADFDGFVTPRGRPEELSVFFSYGWLDTIPAQHRVQDRLFEQLQTELERPPERYSHLPRIRLWRDAESIRNDTAGTPQMDAACEAAFLGFLVVSTKYGHSEACKREAGFFLDDEGNNRPGKRCMVVRFNLPHKDVPKRFRAQSRICLNGPNDTDFLTFWEKAGVAARHNWIREVANKIFASAAEYLGDETPPPTGGWRSGRWSDHAVSIFSRQDARPTDDPVRAYFHGTADRLQDEERSATPLAAASSGQPIDGAAEAHDGIGTDIVAHLAAWAGARDCKRPRLAALLGDFGMGKTVTCQLLTRRLLEAAKADAAAPFPIYFDLREVDRPNRPEGLTLEGMLNQMLERAGESSPSASEVIKFARAKHSVVIFDGLDEITNKVSADRAKAIYRELLAIVPTELWARDMACARSGQEVEAGPSILVSCRSQYFASFASQRAFLSDADRSGIGESMVYIMLPFTRAQIEQYLERNLPEDDQQRCLDLLDSTGDLSDLASRPILLRYIGALVDRLEREKAAGRAINLARLYDILVDQTFQRDDPKHALRIQDKKKLLEGLALHMHRRGQDQISSERLADWLDAEIAKHQALAKVVASPNGLSQAEIFAQDLRNATLLSRPGDDGFQFGHTSLREFFLARALYRAVLDGRAGEVWDLPDPSRETLAFMVQHHAVEEAPERSAFERGFARLLDPGQPRSIRALAFALWQTAHELGPHLPCPPLMDLSSLDLRDRSFAGLAFAGTDFSAANLLGCSFDNVTLTNCHFAGAVLSNTRFDRCTIANCDGPSAAQSMVRLNRTSCDSASDTALFAGNAWRSNSGSCDWELGLLPKAVAGRIAAQTMGLFAVAFSPDGLQLATAAGNRTAQLWEVASGAELRRFEGHGDTVTSVAFSPDGALLATASGDGTARLWDTASGAELRRFEGHGDTVTSVAFSPDGGKLVTASIDRTARLWEVASGAELRRFEGHDHWVWSIAVSPNGAWLATTSMDRTARLWEVASGAELRRFEGLGLAAVALAFSPDGAQLAISWLDGPVWLCDTACGAELRCFVGPSDWVKAMAFSPDGAQLTTASFDGTARLWDIASGAELRRFEGRSGGLTAAAFSLDGAQLATASFDGTARLWDAASGTELCCFEGHGETVSAATFSPDGMQLAAGMHDGTARLWDATNGAELCRFEGHNRTAKAIAFSPNGTQLATASVDRTARLWDAASGAELRRFEGHAGPLLAVAFSPDGTQLATASEDATIRLWDAASGAELRRFEGHDGPVLAVAFSPDCTLIATVSDNRTARLWDTASGAELRRFESLDGFVKAIVFSPDGAQLAVVSRNCSVWLLDVASGTQLAGHEVPDWASKLVHDAAQGSLVAEARGAVITIRDAATKAHIRTILPLPEGWAHLDESGNVTRMTPDGWKYVHGLKTEEDGSVSVVNVWDYLPDQGGEAEAG